MSGSKAQLLAYESAHGISATRDDVWVSLPYTPFDVYVDNLRGQVCIYCSAELEIIEIHEGMRQSLAIKSCAKCGWWSIFRRMVGGQDNVQMSFRIADAKVFDVADIEAPLESLRRYLGRNPFDLAEVNPTRFERLMRDCLEDEFAPCEVQHLGGTADGGIDLKLIQSDQEPVLVQVKRSSDLTSAEGLDVIRGLNGVLFRKGLARGMVVTTAARYTQGAKGEARSRTAGMEGRYEVQLRALDDVVSMLQIPKRTTSRPWLEYLPAYYGLGGGLDDSIEEHLEQAGVLPPLPDAKV